jgi:hypothetical protein
MSCRKALAVLLILNCKKYEYKAEHQKQTWLKEMANIMPYFHVIGDPTLSDPYLFNESTNQLFVQTNDDYNSLPAKVVCAFNAIHSEFNYQYIFKTDDDQMVANTTFFTTLLGVLMKKTPSIHYGGRIVDIQHPHISQYYKIHSELPTNILITRS